MRLGAVFPQVEIGDDPAAIRLWAEAVEEMGFEHIVAYDHVLGAGTDTRPGWTRYDSETPFHEVFVLFGYLAAVTRSVELVTGVLVLPQRQTALVAKQAAALDVLSGGRVRLGVGVGWNEVEYEALGATFSDRGRRSEEQVEVMRLLWANPTVTYTGRWHRIDNAGIKPRPAAGRVPVWFGGTAETVLRRIGRIGDGWLPQSPPDEQAKGAVERLYRYVQEAGRSPEDVGLEARLSLGRRHEDEWRDFAAGWRDLGATHLSVNTMGSGLSSADGHVAALRRALDAIRPATGR